MIALKETTKWDTPNHTYLFKKANGKCVGYIKEGSDDVVMFVKPTSFDKRRRTFTEVKCSL